MDALRTAWGLGLGVWVHATRAYVTFWPYASPFRQMRTGCDIWFRTAEPCRSWSPVFSGDLKCAERKGERGGGARHGNTSRVAKHNVLWVARIGDCDAGLWACGSTWVHDTWARHYVMSIYLHLYLSLSTFFHLSIYLWTYIFISVYMFIYVSMYLCIYVSMYLCIYVFIYVSMYLCIYVSIYLYVDR